MNLKKAFRSWAKLLRDRDYRFIVLSNLGFYRFMKDEAYLKRRFRAKMEKELNLEDLKTFNEKLQWLKLHNRDPLYTQLVDKYEVRRYIAQELGEEYLIPLLGVWDDPDAIDFDSLPDRFVLKCNHNSGLGMCICRDKSKLDIQKTKAELRKGLAQDYYQTGREWPYRDVPRKIVCEQYMTDSADQPDSLTDYKFFCFDGHVDCVMLCLDRHTGDTKYYFFDHKWDLKRLNIRGKNAPEGFTLPKPLCMDEMFAIAEKLSKNMPFVRVDLYECGGKVYFGELTFFPDSGFDSNLLAETDGYWGALLRLPEHKGELK